MRSTIIGDHSGTRHRKSEKEEDEELLHDDDEEDEGVYVYDESPACESRNPGMQFGGLFCFAYFRDSLSSRQGRQDA